jgi:hypothetical protein
VVTNLVGDFHQVVQGLRHRLLVSGSPLQILKRTVLLVACHGLL